MTRFSLQKKNILLVVAALLLASTFSIPSFTLAAEDDITDLQKHFIQMEILKKVRSSYVDTTVNTSDLLDAAIEGMIKQLDPHSSFMPVKAASDFNERIQGNFEGIGVSFAMINDKITVLMVIPEGPSEAAGLKSRDKIVRINNRNVVGIETDGVRELLRGEAGSKVAVFVERPGESDLLEFSITRGRVNLNSVSQAFMIDDDTGYIKVSRFSMKTHYEVGKALQTLRERGMKKLVFDLRGNSGGFLDAAVQVVDGFFGEKGLLILETRGKHDSNRYFSTGEGEFGEIPLIVMINHASASASEIVAGALQDHDRALIVGQTSFGKGLVMNPMPIREGRKQLGTLVLSTAHYYTPSGRLIQRPYDEGREQYIREGFDDEDPNAADSTKAGRPVFHTDLGRDVYGGGGITPDVQLESLRKLNSLERSLRNSYLVFEFADDYLVRNNNLPETFDVFVGSYDISREEIELFKAFILENDVVITETIPVRDELEKMVRTHNLPEESVDVMVQALAGSGVNLENNLFTQSVHFITREIKSEIARMVWGEEERFKVWQTEDTELDSALTLFDNADELLRRRIALGPIDDNDDLR